MIVRNCPTLLLAEVTLTFTGGALTVKFWGAEVALLPARSWAVAVTLWAPAWVGV